VRAAAPCAWSAQVAGTGKEGRVLKGDLLSHLRGDVPAAPVHTPAAARSGAAAPAPAAAGAAPAAAAAAATRTDTVVAIKGACC
jgi:hypothetical protein